MVHFYVRGFCEKLGSRSTLMSIEHKRLIQDRHTLLLLETYGGSVMSCQMERFAELDIRQNGDGMSAVKSKHMNKTRKYETKIRIRLFDYNCLFYSWLILQRFQ